MNITTIKENIAAQRQQLLTHPLYNDIKSIDDLRHFMEGHVYAVWDFMSLLKALQNKLTCTSVPWLAIGDPQMRYLINEIVLAEETDTNMHGERQSHFEMYVDAMEDLGADTNAIQDFINNVVETQNIFVSIKHSPLHDNIKAFLDFTFRVIDRGNAHEIAAAFTFGREELIPSMFTEILRNFRANFPEANLDSLIYYFERHIELDADEHGPMAMQMIESLCADDAIKWKEAEEVSKQALEKRLALWDAIHQNILHEDLASI
ncbi:MAG: DUF3050 domain-containing protein [Flavobacterium sp.]